MSGSRFCSVNKEFRFEAAHRLMDHPGKCRNLHGHSYRLSVTVCGPIMPDGMVIDFGTLSTAVNDVLEVGTFLGESVIPFDHSVVLNVADPLCNGLLEMCKGDKLPSDMRIIQMTTHPTAEAMAKLFLGMFGQQLSFRSPDIACKISRVDVWETAKACASFASIDNLVFDEAL